MESNYDKSNENMKNRAFDCLNVLQLTCSTTLLITKPNLKFISIKAFSVVVLVLYIKEYKANVLIMKQKSIVCCWNKGYIVITLAIIRFRLDQKIYYGP